ncbi:MAG: hypothetical protein UT21_C0012G0001 [Candidatus Woesebacteria bacterium GW2011_GWA1_39_11b]|nr:MAG: hypothetical protein UT21_C0012G0001 [Candidatus Woesebacteria bacterium GW2011_GWA1_39_11b]
MTTESQEIQELIVETFLKLDKNARATARELNLPRTTVRNHLRRAKNNPQYKTLLNISDDFVVDDTKVLKQQVDELRRQLNNSQKNEISAERIKKTIFKLVNSAPVYPEWLARKKLGNEEIGTPTLVLSDWHFGEVISPSQVFDVNTYNLEIAKNRAMEIIDKTIDLSFNHIANAKYPGIVVAILGDQISGNIHDELRITAEKEVLPTILELVGTMASCLTKLADAFGKVFVPCVAGNHGRLDKKPRAKNMAFSNYDWFSYQMLAKVLESDKRIKFLISDGEDAQYKIYDYTYRISHGSQFKSGDSMIGSIGPIIRGDLKKRASARSMNAEYDTLIIGHFHQSMTIAQRCICNGSLVGYSEYAAKCNFPFEPPTQNFFITHPVHGITFNLPIRIEDKEITNKEWVSWEA